MRVVVAFLFATLMLFASSKARADAYSARGIAVVAVGSTTDAAWPLAQAIYAEALLRPSLDERRARVLAGEAVEGDDVKALSELREGVKGEDAASKQLLAAIADEVGAQAVLLVSDDGSRIAARQWIASSKQFDAATYVASREDGKIVWPGVAVALKKQYAPIVQASAKPIKSEKPTTSSKPFYLSPWFWGALGAAVLGAVAVILATQDLSSDSIKLQLRGPK